MATDLLDRRSRSPAKVYAHKLSGTTSRPAYSGIANVQFYSSSQNLEITNALFKNQKDSVENHTDRLSAAECEVITRRGKTLILKITMSQELSGGYIVSLTFVPVFRPRDRFGQFRANGEAKGTCHLWLSIAIPASFPVGKYHAHITLSVKGKVDITAYFHNKAIVILFDPWNTADDAYMLDEEQRKVYVEEDVGVIWRGTESRKVPLHWEYGQYEDHCLDVALYLLRELTADECRVVSTVSRCIISKVNSRDNSGLLTVSPNGSNVGGTHPCRWTGSTAIISKFFRTKTPVRYGQCWVFAGVTVSLLRALGIACRPVTCYNAAHSVQKLGQVDRYFSSTGELMPSLGKDQLWVYHVWCEAWMRRDDLPQGHDGWQALDPTSQDRQSGRFRIGPASVKAIKQSQSGKKWPYDVEYVLSRITADVTYYRVTSNFSTVSNQAISLARVNKGEVGTSLVTSSPLSPLSGHLNPLDRTADYKDTHINSELPVQRFPCPPTRDCSFIVTLSGGVKLGDDIGISVTVCNKGAMLRRVDGRVVGTAIYYTGQPARSFMSMDFTGLVSPGQSATVNLPIEAKKYLRSLVEQAMLQFFVAVKVRETKQLFLKAETIQLGLPELLVQCPSEVTQGKTFRVRISFTNILQRSLTRVLFLLQAQALCHQRELSHKRLVLPGAMASVELTLTANPPGTFSVLVSMFCDQLTDVRGYASLTVTVPPTPG